MSIPTSDRIFISYSRRDDETMRKIAFRLRDQGFKVWVDNEKLVPGTSAWEEGIENAIKNALAMIVILSPDSKSSEWVRREITYADQFQKRVFPVLAKGSEEMSLPIRLVTRQYVDLRTDEEAGLDTLCAAIRFYVEEKQTLEMRRPQQEQKVVAARHSAQVESVTTKKPPLSKYWILPAGIFLASCALAVGALGIFGFRFFSSLPSSTPTELVIPTLAAPTSTGNISPIPTNTSIPIEPTVIPADKLSEYLEGVQALDSDTFDDPSGRGWVVQEAIIRNGVMRIDGNANWDGAFWDQGVTENEGIVMDFSYASGSLFEIFVDQGAYDSDAYKRFGVYIGGNTVEINIWEGRNNTGGTILSGDLTLEPETTYTILISILPDGEFLLALWNPQDPVKALNHRATFDLTWANSTWTFYLQANRGSILFDNFRRIAFNATK